MGEAPAQDGAAGSGAGGATGEEAASARPRVGLVLSSGGAHSLAQVGALEALEELRIPVDFVAGSEMGALIGGLYAAGLPAVEVHALVYSPPWVDALSGKVLRRSMSWRQRTVDRDFLVDLPIAFGPDGFGLADGVSRTRWLSWLLSSATVELAGTENFDDFPIPFRTVAADMLEGDRVVFSSGDVSAAIVASLATPGWFPAVQIGEQQFASGALVDPVPVRLGLDAGCETLIVIDCALDLGRAERLDSFVTAATQAGLLAGESNRRRSIAALRPQDIHLVPRLEGVDEDDLRTAADAIDAGRQAVMAVRHRLAPLALDEEAWQRHVEERHARRPVLPVLGSVRFDDRTGLDDAVLRARVRSEEGQPLDREQLSKDLLGLYGLDYHDRIDLSWEEREDGSADLLLTGLPASDAQWNPRAGAAFEGVFGKDATFVVGAAFAIRPLDGHGAEWRNRIEVGSSVLLFSEYYQPIDDEARWFIAPGAEIELKRVNLTEDEQVVAAFDGRAVGLRLDVGRVLAEWGELRVGLVKEAADFDLAIGDPNLFSGTTSVSQGFLRGELQVDTMDSLALPGEGWIGRVVYRAPVGLLSGDDEQFIQMQLDHAQSRGRTTLLAGIEYATALDQQGALANTFDLGGFLRLSGLGRDSISGAHAALGRVAVWRAFAQPRLEPRTLEWYVGGSLEVGNVWNRRDQIELKDLRPSGSLFLALDSVVGPAFAGVGLTSPGEFAVFLTFGNQFGDWDLF
jgi:NTE family protein